MNPPGHDGVEAEARRDGRALKVPGLACGVFREDVGCDVEASQTGEAAEDEEGET
jgi:hypothetical protein